MDTSERHSIRHENCSTRNKLSFRDCHNILAWAILSYQSAIHTVQQIAQYYLAVREEFNFDVFWLIQPSFLHTYSQGCLLFIRDCGLQGKSHATVKSQVVMQEQKQEREKMCQTKTAYKMKV